jgi:hypothetical protein
MSIHYARDQGVLYHELTKIVLKNFNMMKLYNKLVIRLFKDMHFKMTINWPLQNYVIQGFDGDSSK